MMPPLALAYIGDCVYELYVREKLLSSGITSVRQLHDKAISYVNAKGQAERLKKIMDLLTEEERDIIKRGRNAKSATVPKNANVLDYRYATGLEALIGYLYLSGNVNRLMFLLDRLIGDVD
ncbi:Mini-ribonuclease 3 [Caldanaerobius polysaccharolyticus]|uniref:Mini-ribonuclease 3 n=1 Tax=Caldanaerobius polysaccharolyticus TaxID=44256 RepID=UPI001C54DFE7|nr:ribonuclease III domain-containing protein [Caldanaerobius polysaccharolyticus]